MNGSAIFVALALAAYAWSERSAINLLIFASVLTVLGAGSDFVHDHAVDIVLSLGPAYFVWFKRWHGKPEDEQ